MPQKVEISVRTILFIAALLLGGWFFVQIIDILLLIFVAFILTSALHPLVDKLSAYRIPRALAIALLYIIGVLIIVFSSSTLFPPLVAQMLGLFNQLPEYAQKFLQYFNIRSVNLENFTGQLAPITQNIFLLTVGIFSNIISLITVFVITFYFLLERPHLEKHIATLFGKTRGESIFLIIGKIEEKLGSWVRGQLLLMFIIGFTCFLGLVALRIENALALGVLAGVLEIVPIIGPIISAVPAILVALATSSSPFLALVVAGLYFAVQHLENNFVVPTIMRHSVGLSPVFTLLALMIGGRLGGIGGALLAVPLVVTIQVLIQELWMIKR